MRPTLVLRIHPTQVLIPQMYMGATLRHPSDARQHAKWDELRRQEGYEGLWRKGEWREVAPERDVKIDMKSRLKAIINAPFTPLPSSRVNKPSNTNTNTNNDITSQLNSNGNGNDDGHSKKGGDKMDGMPVKKKVPAANVFWTDHLRML